MKFLILALAVRLIAAKITIDRHFHNEVDENTTANIDHHNHNRVVCYWNSASFDRTGPARFELGDLIPALPLCTHLIYGFAGISPSTFKVVSLNPFRDTGTGYAYYALTTQLKQSFPNLKIYLSIGGNADPSGETHKYLTLPENQESRTVFINSVTQILSEYDFDGIDLAWQFPPVKVQTKKETFSSIWDEITKSVGLGEFEDEKELQHRDGFKILVKDLKAQLQPKNKSLTLTVLPHIDSSIYYDAKHIHPDLDAIHIMTFDRKTPERNPSKDFTAPIDGSYDHTYEYWIDSAYGYWLLHGTPATKIVIGISTFSRTWKLNGDSEISGVPPVTANGPGAAGLQTHTPGLLSFPEVCSRLDESLVRTLKRVGDSTKKYAGFAYQSYNAETKAEGIWVAYEDPFTARKKAVYAKAKGLGGVAIYDISLDDFRGGCNGEKFPILRAAQFQLHNF